MDRVQIFDTTLRDGEQSPGATMNVEEKLAIARQLEHLGVDVIEAGFAASSEGDFESVRRVAAAVAKPIVLSLARTREQDVDRAIRAVEKAKRPGIHIFIATSDIHLQHKLMMSRKDVLDAAVWAVRRAKQHLDYVEFSAEDASRSDPEYLIEVFGAVIDAGACTVNVPDTTGYALPEEYGALFRMLRERVPGGDRVIWSAHCHNDLGMAVANSLAAVQNGARQIECTVNGIGERAGNTSMEEVVMAIKTRRDRFGVDTGIVTEQIYPTSRLLAQITGIPIPINKPIVGDNAFAHEAGIHQDGVLKERETYEIMDATTVGLRSNSIVLGKHSGRHALSKALEEMGFELDGQALNTAFKRFKEIADRKKQVTAMDLEALVTDELREEIAGYTLDWFEVDASSLRPPHAKVSVNLPDGSAASGSFTGDGPIDAVFQAINAATGVAAKLSDFTIGAVTEGQDALGEVSIVLEVDGSTGAGQGVSTDIIDAAARAYLRALSVAVARSHAGGAIGLPETI